MNANLKSDIAKLNINGIKIKKRSKKYSENMKLNINKC